MGRATLFNFASQTSFPNGFALGLSNVLVIHRKTICIKSSDLGISFKSCLFSVINFPFADHKEFLKLNYYQNHSTTVLVTFRYDGISQLQTQVSEILKPATQKAMSYLYRLSEIPRKRQIHTAESHGCRYSATYITYFTLILIFSL